MSLVFIRHYGFDRGKWYGNSYKNVPDDDAECLYPKNRFGEFSSVANPGNYNATGYWPKKLVSINSSFRNANDISWENYAFPDMRFADLLLLCAEALNESKDAPDAEVYKYVDMVRERAGLTPLAAYTDRALQNERRWELAFEGSRYYDLLRWGHCRRIP